MAKFIDQKRTLKSDYGLVLRSSAIFYYRKDKDVQTTISFLNHWLLKRDLKVCIIANIRSMDGTLIRRQELQFLKAQVINFSPFSVDDAFEGSVEIEVFSTQNLVIPYAGILALYETSNGITAIHAYTRIYSQHEVEEKRTIDEGQEACWTIDDTDDIDSFGIFHNGDQQCEPQLVTLNLLTSSGSTIKREFQLRALKPYETVFIKPKEHFEKLLQILSGKSGYLAIKFKNKNCFTRMLIGHQRVDRTDMQVTHTNYNYSIHKTDFVDTDKPLAYFRCPNISDVNREVIVYPDCDLGRYKICDEQGKTIFFQNGQPPCIRVVSNDQGVLTFQRLDGNLPSRIVTGLRLQKKPDRIRGECSLNVYHHKYFKKYYTWGAVAAGKQRFSRIFLTEMQEVYGSFDNNTKGTFLLYASGRSDVLERPVSRQDIERLKNGLRVEEVFDQANEFLGNLLGYLVLKTEYPGLIIYSTYENDSGSISIEHWF